MSKTQPEELKSVPRHIAIIMDGNGRWAKARLLPRMAGHRAGAENLRRIIKACVEFGIPYLTIYAFSTENWSRPKDEVDGLMDIFADLLEREVPELHDQGVQIRHLGKIEDLSPTLQKKLLNAIDFTKENDKLVLCIALNYGGRDEIVQAVRKIISEGITADKVNPQVIADHLFTAGIPDPDLIIRTSGEVRTSNYLVWQSAYSEWLFTATLWPDFDKENLRKAILEYNTRTRKFGGRTSEEKKEAYNA
ncbi:MAG: isoprenyl transferase [Chloroflexi bacterium]|jgi:undecaprenyl diphosphate synthase|nr:isoprenyl transferase [Chloroflexota bacterium]